MPLRIWRIRYSSSRGLEDVVVLDPVGVRVEALVAAWPPPRRSVSLNRKNSSSGADLHRDSPVAAARSIWRRRMRRGDTSTGSPVCSSTRSQMHDAPSCRATAPAAAWPGRARRRSRRSPGPSWRSGSRAAASCRRRRPGGSCTPRCSPSQHVVEEEAARHALAHEPALHVGEHDEHGVDRRRLSRRRQLLDAQRPRSIVIGRSYSGVV